jgi:hypothetical protein
VAIPTTRISESTGAADAALRDVLAEIAVPAAVLDEAKQRRDLVLDIAMEHPGARARYVSGSVAHGTENRPLEDTDCGIKVDRRYEEFRVFGADGEGRGPEAFIQSFADFVLPKLRERGYPNAEVNLDGNRAIKPGRERRPRFSVSGSCCEVSDDAGNALRVVQHGHVADVVQRA